jgi:hypothetical protein
MWTKSNVSKDKPSRIDRWLNKLPSNCDVVELQDSVREGRLVSEKFLGCIAMKFQILTTLNR